MLREETIRYAHRTAQSHTGIPVCPTGASGLAGLTRLTGTGVIDPGDSVGLFFTGFDRAASRVIWRTTISKPELGTTPPR